MSLPASDLTKKPDMRTTMELGAVLPETAEVRDDHLFIGGVDMVELARKEGTALYVFDEADLRHRMEAYREAFRSRYENSDIIYASKAFLNKDNPRRSTAIQPPGKRFAGFEKLFPAPLVKQPASSRIYVHAAPLRRPTHGGHLLRNLPARTETGVQHAPVLQRLKSVFISAEA